MLDSLPFFWDALVTSLIDEVRIEQDRARLRKIDALIEKFLASSPDGQNKEAVSRIVQENKSLLSKDIFFRLAELANVSTKPEERQSFLAFLQLRTIAVCVSLLSVERQVFIRRDGQEKIRILMPQWKELQTLF